MKTLKFAWLVDQVCFRLSCDATGEAEHWILDLCLPVEGLERKWWDRLYIGSGDTPEAAYRDVLKKTAVESFALGL